MEKRGSDKHEQWKNMGCSMTERTAGINPKRICSYNMSFRVLFLGLNAGLVRFLFPFFIFIRYSYAYGHFVSFMSDLVVIFISS